MPAIIWDRVGARVYETGLDRGVLYTQYGKAVPWNGLTSVVESSDKEVSPVYYDGMKIQDAVAVGDFVGTMKAVTYPDEFIELEGLGESSSHPGVFYGEQEPQLFSLAYRTKIANDVESDDFGYKIHLIANLTAVPSDKTYATQSNDPSLVEFEWKLTAVPVEIEGRRPTAHLILDTRYLDPWLLEDLEKLFYGTVGTDPALPPLDELAEFIDEWARVKITDNGDGTWTATSAREGFISVNPDGSFEMTNVNALYLSEDEYELTDTVDIADVPQIKIVNNGNGTWNAETNSDALISIEDGTFEIFDANVVWLNDYTYRISDTEN